MIGFGQYEFQQKMKKAKLINDGDDIRAFNTTLLSYMYNLEKIRNGEESSESEEEILRAITDIVKMIKVNNTSSKKIVKVVFFLNDWEMIAEYSRKINSYEYQMVHLKGPRSNYQDLKSIRLIDMIVFERFLKQVADFPYMTNFHTSSRSLKELITND